MLAFGLLWSSVFAQEGLKKNSSRVSSLLEQSCESAFSTQFILIAPRVTKQLEHGSTETATAMNFPSYPKENIRSKCNEHKVKGMQVNYKSSEKYVGSDELELLVLFPGGFAWEIHYDISVR